MAYICSGRKCETYSDSTAIPLAAYTRLFYTFSPTKGTGFFMLVRSVHVGRGIIKLVWGVNVESYQGRLCVSLQRLKATAVENGKPASAKPISFKTIRTVPSE